MDYSSILFGMAFVLIPVLVLSQNEAAPQITMRTDQTIVRNGSHVTFSCRLVGFNPNTHKMSFRKQVAQLEPKPTLTETISKSGVLEALYQKTNRYQVQQNTEGADIVSSLSIHNAQLADTGTFQCRATHDTLGLLTAETLIEVYTPPTVIKTNLDGGVITMREGEPLPLPYVCTVPNVMPLLGMEMWITDDMTPVPAPHDSTGPSPTPPTRWISGLIDKWRNVVGEKWRDVTEQFMVGSEAKIQCAQIPEAKDECPLHFDYEMSAINTSRFVGDMRYDGKLLTCLATSREFDRPSVNISVKLHVQYKATITCQNMLPDGTLFVRLNATGQKVSCRIEANPAPTAYHWHLGGCDANVNVPLRDNDEYNLIELAQSYDARGKTVELHFERELIKEYFQRSYCLVVQNDVGPSTKAFNLKETPAGYGEGVRVTVPTLLITTALFLGALIL